MSIESDFRTQAVAHAPLVDLVGQRVALNAVPQGSPLPMVAYTVRRDPQYTLDNTLVADTATIEAQCWAQTSVQAEAVADALAMGCVHVNAVRSCVDIGRSTGYDSETDLHACIVTFEWMV